MTLRAAHLDLQVAAVWRDLVGGFYGGTEGVGSDRRDNRQVTVNISGGSVGVLNVGEMHRIRKLDVTVKDAWQQSPELALIIEKLTGAALSLAEITTGIREQALEDIRLLAAQGMRVPEDREPKVIASAMNRLTNVLSAGGAVAEIWSTWGPQLSKWFGI